MTRPDPSPHPLPPGRTLLRLLAIAAAVGVLACGLTVGAGRLATLADPRPAIRHGIEAGAIPQSDQPEPQGLRGPNPFNECLVYLMAALPGADPWQAALAPQAPGRIVRGLRGVQVCPVLAVWARTGVPPPDLEPYGRYLHGDRLVAAAALALDAVAWLPPLLQATAYGVLLAPLPGP